MDSVLIPFLQVLAWHDKSIAWLGPVSARVDFKMAAASSDLFYGGIEG